MKRREEGAAAKGKYKVQSRKKEKNFLLLSFFFLCMYFILYKKILGSAFYILHTKLFCQSKRSLERIWAYMHICMYTVLHDLIYDTQNIIQIKDDGFGIQKYISLYKSSELMYMEYGLWESFKFQVDKTTRLVLKW